MNKICVMGAGLAGLYAAKEAAIHGADVTIVEKKKDVGDALKCGELFTTIYGMPPAKCITREIKSWIFDYCLVKGIETGLLGVKLPDGFCVMTDRATHERILKEECEKLGVKFEFGKVAIEFEPNDYDWVIMATGIASWKGGRATANCYTMNCTDNKNCDYAYFRMLSDMKGYFWAFPKTNNEANIGGGCEFSSEFFGKMRFDKIADNVSNVFELKDKIMSGGGWIPVNTEYRETYNYFRPDIIKNAMFVGDAAGLVNPMLLGGEHLAMVSGQLAGYIVATESTIESGDMIKGLTKYYNGITSIIAPEMEMGIFINNMRKIMSPQEYYEFISGALESKYRDMNNVIIKYIQRIMPKYRKIADVKNEELEELI